MGVKVVLDFGDDILRSAESHGYFQPAVFYIVAFTTKRALKRTTAGHHDRYIFARFPKFRRSERQRIFFLLGQMNCWNRKIVHVREQTAWVILNNLAVFAPDQAINISKILAAAFEPIKELGIYSSVGIIIINLFSKNICFSNS